MATSISNAVAIAMLNTCVDALDAGIGAGYINFYDNVPPDYVDDAPIGTLLVKCVLSSTAFGAATDNAPDAKAVANAIADGTATAAGTLGWYRAFTGSDIPIIQGIVGTEMVVSSPTVVIGSKLTVVSWTIFQREK